MQGYFEFKHPQRKTGLIEKFPRASFRVALANAEKNRKYCTKENTIEKPTFIFEQGEPKQQGKRNDLQMLLDSIKEGAFKSKEELIFGCPKYYNRYRFVINEAWDICCNKRIRLPKKNEKPEPTEYEWYYGETGVGKSKKVYQEKYEEDNTYLWKADRGWWDAYDQQEKVIMNDFRGEIPYNDMLNLADIWPAAVSRRGTCPRSFTSRKIYITSSLPPEKVYKNREQEDNIAQLLRRFKVIKINNDGTETVMSNPEDWTPPNRKDFAKHKTIPIIGATIDIDKFD